ncbi:hypothetical protein B0A55_06620 [Friedmanniomyces simplex]|uniref:Uncharacterized protein n=1 Tax=Friedmanniomyces simplex TaxID=329884 RepID=A0A4U0XDE4_9PEZI|nr:hypothetical protein B0A55_06620 [Friedmanniomyces simplex]
MLRLEAVRGDVDQQRFQPLQPYQEAKSIKHHCRPRQQMFMFFVRTQRPHDWHSPAYRFNRRQAAAFKKLIDVVSENLRLEEDDPPPQLRPIHRACLAFCVELLNQTIHNKAYDMAMVCTMAVLEYKTIKFTVDQSRGIVHQLVEDSRRALFEDMFNGLVEWSWMQDQRSRLPRDGHEWLYERTQGREELQDRFVRGATESQKDDEEESIEAQIESMDDNAAVSHDLASKIESFVLVTERMLSGKFDRFPHRAGADRDWRYRCAAAFWQHLLSELDPLRIVVLAPPTDLACLTNCAIDTFGDWAFGDMEYHALDLRLDAASTSPSPLLGKTVQYSTLDHTPRRFPGIAGSSVLNLRPWHHITINEGAFLKAFSTYEYFERGPPSLIYSIKDCLTPRPTYTASVQRLSHTPLSTLRKLSYIAIFPFATHLDFRDLLPQLEELDLQLAPTLSAHGSSILNDPQRLGKAELQDCWSELLTVYQNLAAQLATFRITEWNVPRLKKLVCRDMEREALRRDLDELFIPLCLPVWAEMETGVYARLRMRADVEPV